MSSDRRNFILNKNFLCLLIVIVVDGIIASKKSTVLKRLGEKRPDFAIYVEPVEAFSLLAGTNLMADFYADMKLNAFRLQSHVLNCMCDLGKIVSCETRRVIVVERGFDAASEVFIPTLYNRGALTTWERECLTEMHKNLRTNYRQLYVEKCFVLKSQVEKAMDRVLERCREGESFITEDYLKQLSWQMDKYYCGRNDVVYRTSSIHVDDRSVEDIVCELESSIDSLVNNTSEKALKIYSTKSL